MGTDQVEPAVAKRVFQTFNSARDKLDLQARFGCRVPESP